MTDKTPTITRAQALELVIPWCEENGRPDAAEVLRKMLVSITRKPENKMPSKASVENAALLNDCINAMIEDANGEPVPAKWFTEHVRGILTPQKAVAVLKVGQANGTIEKVYVDKKALYRIA